MNRKMQKLNNRAGCDAAITLASKFLDIFC